MNLLDGGRTDWQNEELLVATQCLLLLKTLSPDLANDCAARRTRRRSDTGIRALRVTSREIALVTPEATVPAIAGKAPKATEPEKQCSVPKEFRGSARCSEILA